MSTFLERFEERRNASMEKTAEEQAVEERIELMSKYAEAADAALYADHGDDYTEDDVVELAQHMINADAEAVENEGHEKTAEEMDAQIDELYGVGRIIGQGIKDELDN